MSNALHRENQRAYEKLIEAQDREVNLNKNPPPPGKIRILATDVDPKRKYVRDQMDERQRPDSYKLVADRRGEKESSFASLAARDHDAKHPPYLEFSATGRGPLENESLGMVRTSG
jgi:hypothetical protein